MLIFCIASTFAFASQALEIDADESLIAIVTHKEGLASGLAHEHLVAIRDCEAKLELDPDQMLDASFSLRFDVRDLEVDVPEIDERWRASLLEWGVLTEPKKAVSEGDRKKISKAMLGRLAFRHGNGLAL